MTHYYIRLTALFQDNLGKPAPEKQNHSGKTNLDVLEQEIVSGSDVSWAVICKSAPRLRQITMPVFYRLDALPAAQQTASKHWRQYYVTRLKTLVNWNLRVSVQASHTWRQGPAAAWQGSVRRPAGVHAGLDSTCTRRWWASRRPLGWPATRDRDRPTGAAASAGPCSDTDRWNSGSWSRSSDTSCLNHLQSSVNQLQKCEQSYRHADTRHSPILTPNLNFDLLTLF